MNITPGSYQKDNIVHKLLSDHDNFFLEYKGETIKIYPELVEVAEHVVLGLEHNPEFKNKIMNAEYDMLIGDDVSGRPVTLLIKHLIDHFRDQKGLSGGIDNIFIDSAYEANNQANINQKQHINTRIQDKKILITTEFIFEGRAIEDIIKIFSISQQDVFTQLLGQEHQQKNPSRTIHYQITNNKNNIYNVFYGHTAKMPPKIYDNTHENKNNLIGLISQEQGSIFSQKLLPKLYNQQTINNTRQYIKLLAEYIIENYLSHSTYTHPDTQNNSPHIF